MTTKPSLTLLLEQYNALEAARIVTDEDAMANHQRRATEIRRRKQQALRA